MDLSWLPSLAAVIQFAPAQQDACANWPAAFIHVANLGFNTMSAILILYVTQVTRRLDKEVLNGGE